MKTALFIALLVATPAVAADFPTWMAGSWRLDAGNMVVEEHWTAPGGAMMLGMSKTVRAKGTTSFEFLRVVETNGTLAYLAMPNGRPATAFPLQTSSASRVVFENLQHDYPQRVIYWRDGKKLCARIEGLVNGKVEGEQWCYDPMTP